MQKSNGFIFIKERNITLLSFDGITYFFKEIEPSVVIIFLFSIFFKDFSIIDGFAKILNICFFLFDHSITGNIKRRMKK